MATSELSACSATWPRRAYIFFAGVLRRGFYAGVSAARVHAEHTLTIVDAATGHFGVTFTAPQVILFSADVERASAFYRRLGFHETFRVPAMGRRFTPTSC